LLGLWREAGLPQEALGHVQVALAQTGHWLRNLGRVPDGFQAPPVAREPYLETMASGFGELRAVRHSARLSRTPVAWTFPSMPPGSSLPQWRGDRA